MTRYVPSSVAPVLSEAMWRLSVPALATRSTRYLFAWITSLDGSQWLIVDPEQVINVHAEAELGEIAEILAPWVGHGITQGDIDDLAGVVESHRGGTMAPWEFFPPMFKDLSKSHEEMIAAGLLVEPDGLL